MGWEAGSRLKLARGRVQIMDGFRSEFWKMDVGAE